MQNFAQPKQIRFCAIKQNWIDMRVWVADACLGCCWWWGTGPGEPRAAALSWAASSSQQPISNVGEEEHSAASRGQLRMLLLNTNHVIHLIETVAKCLIINNKHSVSGIIPRCVMAPESTINIVPILWHEHLFPRNQHSKQNTKWV